MSDEWSWTIAEVQAAPDRALAWIRKLEALVGDLRRKREELARQLAASQFVDDGQWICETCGFTLMKAVLRASDGAVGIDTREVQDICPNDGTSLRRLTWKEDAANANRVAMDQMKRADELACRLAAQTEALTKIASDPSCGCTHDTADCCAVVGEFCPACIAAQALAARKKDNQQ